MDSRFYFFTLRSQSPRSGQSQLFPWICIGEISELGLNRMTVNAALFVQLSIILLFKWKCIISPRTEKIFINISTKRRDKLQFIRTFSQRFLQQIEMSSEPKKENNYMLLVRLLTATYADMTFLASLFNISLKYSIKNYCKLLKRIVLFEF